jgi:hypothetical protein
MRRTRLHLELPKMLESATGMNETPIAHFENHLVAAAVAHGLHLSQSVIQAAGRAAVSAFKKPEALKPTLTPVKPPAPVVPLAKPAEPAAPATPPVESPK